MTEPRVEAGDRALETARCCTRKTCKLSGDSIPDLPESKPDCQDCDETGNCSKHPPLDPEAKADTWEERLAWKIASYLDEFPCVLPENIAHVAALIQSAMNAQERELREALENLVSQLQKCHADQRYQSVWQLYAIHGGQYTGPFYREQLAEAERLLAERGEGQND